MNYPGDEPSKAAKKALEVVDKLISPVTTFLQGKAEASQIRTVAHAESEAAAIKVRAQMRLERDYIRHQENLEAITNKAKQQLLVDVQAGTGDESGKQIDQDWLSKFSDLARHTSDDDIQNLWARILAGEAKQPGNYSVRLMYTLHTLTKQDATFFQIAANYVWGCRGIGFGHLWTPKTEEYLAKNKDLPWGVWAHLASIGLVDNTPQVSITLKVGDSVKLQYGGKEWEIRAEGKSEKLNFRPLTRVGIELHSLCTPIHDPEYEQLIVEHLRQV